MQRKSGKDFCLFPLLRSWQDKEKFPFLRSWQDNAKLRALNKAGKIYNLPVLLPHEADATGCFLFPAEYHLDGS